MSQGFGCGISFDIADHRSFEAFEVLNLKSFEHQVRNVLALPVLGSEFL